MEKDVVAVIVCMIIAIVLFIMYLITKNSEIGSIPRYEEEVYHIAVNNGAKPYVGSTPTTEQKNDYIKSGGIDYTGGYWLYGPKPKKGSYGVSPFNNTRWFR
jgi:hypothetical protein